VEKASVEKMTYPLPDKPSIAVLPFVNMSDDPKQEYLSDGFTEDLITTISKIPDLFVISRQSTFTYKGKPVKVQTVAEDLGVRYVLEGSIQRSGKQLRINVQLIDAIKGHHIWSERYDRQLEDLFKLKEDIILKVANELLVELVSGEYLREMVSYTDKPKPWQTNNLEAWETYWLGMKSYRRYRKEDCARARDLFTKALELDSNWYLPLVMIGWTHRDDARHGWSESRKKSFDQAAEIAYRVIDIYDQSATAHHLLGNIHLMKREYDKAYRYYEKALRLNPNAAYTQAAQGGVLVYLVKPKEAILHYKKAMRLSPFYPAWYLSRLGLAYHLDGQYEKAIEALKQGIKRKPDQYFIHVRLAAVYSDLGRIQEARAEAAEVLRIKPDFSVEAYAKANPFKDPAVVEHRKKLLRAAGLK
jgi:adenylate cyclase